MFRVDLKCSEIMKVECLVSLSLLFQDHQKNGGQSLTLLLLNILKEKEHLYKNLFKKTEHPKFHSMEVFLLGQRKRYLKTFSTSNRPGHSQRSTSADEASDGSSLERAKKAG